MSGRAGFQVTPPGLQIKAVLGPWAIELSRIDIRCNRIFRSMQKATCTKNRAQPSQLNSHARITGAKGRLFTPTAKARLGQHQAVPKSARITCPDARLRKAHLFRYPPPHFRLTRLDIRLRWELRSERTKSS